MIEHLRGQEERMKDLQTDGQRATWLAPNHGNSNADGAVEIPRADKSVLDPLPYFMVLFVPLVCLQGTRCPSDPPLQRA